MDKDFDDSDLQTSQEGDNGQSLVGKLKKNVSEMISNTPLSKWFRKQNDATPTSSIRRRQDDSEDEEDLQEFQPPMKRTKLPPTKETLSLNVSEVLSPISSVNNVKRPLYRNFPEPIAGPSGYQTRKMLNSTSIMSESSHTNTKSREGHETVFKNPKSIVGSTELTNKDSNSDSEASTSGYSSGRVGSKEIVSQENSKQTSPLENSPQKNRSLFQGSSTGRLFVSDRSLSPNRNSSLSSRMPSFNPSTFGSSSFIDRTLSSKRILNSPFYNGHTIYGGASAYGRSTKRAPQDIRKVLRQSVNIKPANRGIEKGNLQLGKTARRILDILEQYSSPVSDAKKIPITSKKHKSEGSLTRYIGSNPYMHRESRSASNRELQVPSITDSLKTKLDQQKTRLQDSTEAVRQIAAKSNSVLNNESYHIPVQRENEKHTTKIKTKITSTRQKLVVEDVMPELRLNPVSLPIRELPKFDIPVPPPVQTPLATSTASIEPVPAIQFNKSWDPKKSLETKILASVLKGNDKLISQKSSEFKFSAPLVLAEYLKPLKALNNFKFSEPLIKKRRSIHPELDDQENKVVDLTKTKKNNGENVPKGIKITGSSMDSMMEQFKPKEGTWECSVCLIRNQADKIKCAACETPNQKIKRSTEPIQGFALPASLRPTENTWECPTCMIRNKEDLQKCAACEEKKPEKSTSNGNLKVLACTGIPQMVLSKPVEAFRSTDIPWECASCHIKNMKTLLQCYRCQKPKPISTPSNVSSSESPRNAFFKCDPKSKFTNPTNTWECSTCMIRNKEELSNCAACESPKPPPKTQPSQLNPDTFGQDFKKKDSEWECQVCMVRNKAKAEKCQCCESSNPHIQLTSTALSNATPKISSFNFGIDKTTATSFTFGIPPQSQTSQNAPKTNAAVVFGEKRDKSSAKGAESKSFTFGVPTKDAKEAKTKDDPPKSSDMAGSPKSTPPEPKLIEATISKPTLSFGAESKPTEVTPTKSRPTFSFGVQPNASETTSSKTTSTFSSASKGEEIGKTIGTPSFSFGAPKASEVVGQKIAAPSLGFGIAGKKSEGADLATAMPTFTFGSGNKTDNKGKEDNKPTEGVNINPLLRPSEKLPEKATVAPVGFSFGIPKAPTPVTPTISAVQNEISSSGESPNKRTKPADSDSGPQAKAPTFSFKAPTTNGDLNKSLLAFSKPAEKSKSPGGFGFNFAAGKTTATTSAIVPPTFGSTVSQADSSKQAEPIFKFRTSSPSKQANGFSFGSPAFGTKTFANATEAKPFTFGSPVASTRAPTSSFGATPPKGMFSFGGTTENKPAPFSFAAPGTENKTATQFSSFGSTTPKTQPSFGFNQPSAPSFSFGATQKTESGFGVGSTTVNPFGAASSKPDSVFAPTQTSGLNGSFNFGTSTSTNQKAGFSFGATSSSESGATQSGFSLGSSTPNTSALPASGGFNFSGPAPSFDANIKPSFNFTGGAGITAFSAPPAQEGVIPPRKIKKAIRRTVR